MISLRDALLATLVMAVWGGNFVSAKYGMHYFPPLFFTFLRFVAVAALLLPFIKWPSRREFLYLVGLSMTLGTGHFALLFAALYNGLSIPTCVIVTQLGVPFTCLLGTIFFKDTLGMWRTMGMFLAFMGLMLVAGTPDVTSNMTGFILAVGGALMWGLANVIMKKMGTSDIRQILGWMAILSVPQLWVISYFMEGNQLSLIPDAPLYAWASIAYTVLCSTLLAYSLWYSLLRKYDFTAVTPFSLLSPVFGIGFGQLFFHEPLGWQIVAGGVLTLVGVAIIVIRRPKNIVLSKSV